MQRIPENKVVDIIDGKTLRNRNPEEYVRQNVARSLLQEYRYDRADIAVEFPIKVGSAKPRIDLAIFGEGKPRWPENIQIIIECKKAGTSTEDKKEGLSQLKSYMAASPNCRFGLWTNGSDQRICLLRSEVAGEIVFDEIVDIPLKGQKLRDAEAPDRLQLRPATGDNLLFAFQRCHNYIAGNQGLQKPEAFWELLKVIFCKIEDERSEGALCFYVTSRERKSMNGQLLCKNRIKKIFQEVKRKYQKIFKANDEIDLNRTVLAYIVAQLQPYSLLESSVDVKGVAYEEIVGSNLRGDRGEFFTPRNACRMAVRMLDPEPRSRVLDPACGTGGFLITAMNHVLDKFDQRRRSMWRNPSSPTGSELAEAFLARQELLSGSLCGLDINPALVRAAKMNMVMNNDGAGGLMQADSLRSPETWSDEVRDRALFDSFDYVFTNPPFGTRITVDSPEVLEQYDLAVIWDLDRDEGIWRKRLDAQGAPVLQASQPPEILFIERCVQFLKPGTGRMAMVIPNGILNNISLGYVRQWILEQTQVMAVVDMQRDLFQPKNDTQTSMVLLRRRAPDEVGTAVEYPIFFVITRRIGHDKRGRPVFLRDDDGNDILDSRIIRARVVEGGEEVEKSIVERVPIIDDDLPRVAPIFRAWARKNYVSV